MWLCGGSALHSRDKVMSEKMGQSMRQRRGSLVKPNIGTREQQASRRSIKSNVKGSVGATECKHLHIKSTVLKLTSREKGSHSKMAPVEPKQPTGRGP